MKKGLLYLASLLLLATLTMAACNDNKMKDNSEEGKAVTKKKKSKNVDAANLPNYRYVDIDSVLSQYNLAKEFNEEMIRMEKQMQSTLTGKQNQLSSLAAGYQKKMEENRYTSKEEFEKDQRSFANAQRQAETEAQKLQQNYANQMAEMQKTINDSIENYIKIYNAQYGYDAILMKAATLYINEDLDITDEVIEGLNKRYNKVK